MATIKFKSGRPVKLTPEIHKIIIEGIKQNLPHEVCAWKAGIHYSSLKNWFNNGKSDQKNQIDSDFARLLAAVKTAEAEKIAAHVLACEEQTERWQARMTILERRWREFFGTDAKDLKEVKRLLVLLKANEEVNHEKQVETKAVRQDEEAPKR